jgi:hypothetical protein
MHAWSWVVALALATEGILLAQVPAPAGRLRVERSPRAIRASNAVFAGVEHGWPAPYRLEEPRSHRSKAFQWDGVVFFDAARLDSTYGGLGRYKPGEARWDSYPLSMVAAAAGWYPQGSRAAHDAIRGLAIGGGRVWRVATVSAW